MITLAWLASTAAAAQVEDVRHERIVNDAVRAVADFCLPVVADGRGARDMPSRIGADSVVVLAIVEPSIPICQVRVGDAAFTSPDELRAALIARVPRLNSTTPLSLEGIAYASLLCPAPGLAFHLQIVQHSAGDPILVNVQGQISRHCTASDEVVLSLDSHKHWFRALLDRAGADFSDVIAALALIVSLLTMVVGVFTLRGQNDNQVSMNTSERLLVFQSHEFRFDQRWVLRNMVDYVDSLGIVKFNSFDELSRKNTVAYINSEGVTVQKQPGHIMRDVFNFYDNLATDYKRKRVNRRAIIEATSTDMLLAWKEFRRLSNRKHSKYLRDRTSRFAKLSRSMRIDSAMAHRARQAEQTWGRGWQARGSRALRAAGRVVRIWTKPSRRTRR